MLLVDGHDEYAINKVVNPQSIFKHKTQGYNNVSEFRYTFILPDQLDYLNWYQIEIQNK